MDSTVPMFDKIAPKYDQLNRILSLGWDQRWRQQFWRLFPKQHYASFLDLATGTGEMILAGKKEKISLGKCWGVDPSSSMLEIAQQKISDTIFLQGSGENIPLDNQTCDLVIIAFGLRNVQSREKTLQEIHRVLKPKGLLGILEFSLGSIPTWFQSYFFQYLPKMAAFLGGDLHAYEYLPSSLKNFPEPSLLWKELKDSGWSHHKYKVLWPGCTHAFLAERS